MLFRAQESVHPIHPQAAGTEGRGSFEGVWQILRFNYPMFAGAIFFLVSGATFLATASLPAWGGWLLAVGMIWVVLTILTTLAVSHHVYDRFPLFTFRWLMPLVGKGGSWANIHAGFDQTTRPLQRAIPASVVTPVDIFDPAVMTEKSIHRARRYYAAVPHTLHGWHNHLPLPDAAKETVSILFAAHELRTPEQRAALFREAARILQDHGKLVVVEHLRDLSNFLAFGPGAFHFHSRRQWLHAGVAARLTLEREIPLTAFARCFVWRKLP